MQEPATINLSSYKLVLTSSGQSVRIIATVLDQDSKVITDATITWRSANNGIARVSKIGLVTAVANGTTQVTVTSGYATASATVSVEQEVGSITIKPTSVTLTAVGSTIQLTAEVKDTGHTVIHGAAVVWSSSDPSVATVDANGRVTAVSNGGTQITATSGGVTAVRSVFVEIAQVAASITLNVSEATPKAVGQSVPLTAKVYDREGAVIPGAPVSWSSSVPEVATVSVDGLVIAVSRGTTRVTATSGGISDYATIHVVIEGTVPPPPPPPVVDRIEIAPPSSTLTEAGETVQLVATVYDTNDENHSGCRDKLDERRRGSGDGGHRRSGHGRGERYHADHGHLGRCYSFRDDIRGHRGARAAPAPTGTFARP